MSAAATLKVALKFNGITAEELSAMPERDALRLPWVGRKVLAAAHRQASPESAVTPHPTSADIRAARLAANLTQTAAGELVHVALRTWQQWEAGDRAMPGAAWELFNLKLERSL